MIYQKFYAFCVCSAIFFRTASFCSNRLPTRELARRHTNLPRDAGLWRVSVFPHFFRSQAIANTPVQLRQNSSWAPFQRSFLPERHIRLALLLDDCLPLFRYLSIESKERTSLSFTNLGNEHCKRSSIGSLCDCAGHGVDTSPCSAIRNSLLSKEIPCVNEAASWELGVAKNDKA